MSKAGKMPALRFMGGERLLIPCGHSICENAIGFVGKTKKDMPEHVL
jgi:hypothetical protein